MVSDQNNGSMTLSPGAVVQSSVSNFVVGQTGTLTGAQNALLQISGGFSWLGGTISNAQVVVTGPTTITDNVAKSLNSSTLTLMGTTAWDEGNINLIQLRRQRIRDSSTSRAIWR